MQKCPVLVTGGAGYIGSHAVLALLDAGWPIAVIDNLTTGFRFAVPDGVPLYEGDIEDSALLARIIAEQKIGAIMHFAGSIIVPESVSDPLKYYHNNTAKTRSLIASAVEGGVPHFIFSSTAATYGVPEVSPVTEDTPQRPINPYGMSKLMSETMLRDTAAAHPLNFCALRYFNVAGADPQGRSGQSTAGATHLIKVAVEAALGKRDKVEVFGTDFDTPDGTGGVRPMKDPETFGNTIPTIVECCTTNTGTALKQILIENPEVVLLDIHFTPEERFEGLWIARQLLARGGFAGRIFLTSAHHEEDLKALATLIKNSVATPGKSLLELEKLLIDKP